MIQEILINRPKSGNSRGRGRGVLGLSSHEPGRRPNIQKDYKAKQEEVVNAKPTKQLQQPSQINRTTNGIDSSTIPTKTSQQSFKINGNVNDIDSSTKLTHSPQQPQINGKTNGIDLSRLKKLLAKYNYKANPEKPGGFDELTIIQGENLYLIRRGHTESNNPLWWEVANEKLQQGFVPASYCMVLEDRPTSLPWLENKRIEEEKKKRQEEKLAAQNGGSAFGRPANSKPVVKPYVSAYERVGGTTAANAAMAAKQYYCEICDKNLNGPQPYKMHMSSKAHREEMEYKGLK